MAVNDLYQVKVEAVQSEERIENVYYYRQTSNFAGNAAQALTDAFEAVVLAAIAAIQVQAITYVRVLVRNLFTPSENFEDITPTPAGGLVLGTAAPPLIAMSFRSVRPDLSKRYSYKRFSGMQRDTMTGEDFTNTASAEVLAVRNALTAQLSPGFGDFIPVQVRITKNLSGDLVYTENYPIPGWTVQGKVSTQNTRKHGRGN